LKGEGIGGRVEGRKREKGGKKGLRGKIFREIRETPRPSDPTRTSFAQNQRPPPIRGRSLSSSPHLAYAHMSGFLWLFLIV